jgi:tetratricopeptide (TPR) repeat protein
MTTMRRGARLALTLASVLVCARAVADERPYDGLQQLIDDEARAALVNGQYLRAEHLFWRLTEMNPRDAHALREAGRAAFALGDLDYAQRALARVETLQAGAPDPEIRYLRGQALLALGRDAEGAAELAEAERQLSPAPPDRQSSLWLARIYALRGDVTRSEAMYRTQLPWDHASAEYAEIVLYIVEAYIFDKDWRHAERILRAFLADQPEHVRGGEMLAWVLEGNGKLAEELPIRAALAESWTDHPQNVLGYARALERAGDDGGALARYREAETLGAKDIGPDIERLARRQSPELAAGMTFGDDVSGSVMGWIAGATLPFGSGLRLAVTGSGATATSGAPVTSLQMPDRATSTSVGAQLLYNRRGYVVAAGPTVRLPGVSSSAGVGVSAAFRTPDGRPLQLHLSAQLGLPWRETSTTIREGGIVDTASVEAFAKLFSEHVILSLTGQGRRLGLAAMAGVDAPHARQLFGAAGVDFVLWSDPARLVRGQILDEDMMWASTLTSGFVVSYRHYELVSDDPFGARLVLVGRSRIEEGSAAFRYVVDDAGAVGVELHGGLGRDTARDVLTSRAGGTLLISATAQSRLTAAYELASQTGTGLSGLRHTGWISLHVDL